MNVGDIIDGRRVTKVYMLCGCEAYDTEPVEDNAKYYKAEPKTAPAEPAEEPKEAPKRRARKKKE